MSRGAIASRRAGRQSPRLEGSWREGDRSWRSPRPISCSSATCRTTSPRRRQHGIVDWRPEWCLGQLRLPGCWADLKIPDLTIPEAAERGAKTMVVGVVNAGGFLPDHWAPVIVAALDAGLDVATGLHVRLADT